MLEEINKSIRKEDNVTSSGEAYSEPLGREEEDADEDEMDYDEQVDKMYRRMVDTIEEIEVLEEISFREFYKDDSKTQRRKINDNIHEMYKYINEVERFCKHAIKLKKKIDADQNVFWKVTFDKFGKITKKLDRIRTMTMELSK